MARERQGEPVVEATDDQAVTVAESWLEQLELAIGMGDSAGLGALFLAESYWRDAVALTWTLRTYCGREAIALALMPAFRTVGAKNFELDRSSTPPRHVTRIGTETTEAFFTFETTIGRGRGVIRLCPDPDTGDHRAWTFLTALDELKGFEERIGRNRPTGQSHSRDFRGPNWLDQRREAAAYRDRDPAVLVVGGGQAGLAIAARLTQLSLDTLIVDRHARIGDNWRLRYHALTLHNQVQVNHLPYMPFPPNWPTYIPKDKLANWFEAYVEAMELNFWTGTEFLGGAHDSTSGRWTARLRLADGSERVMYPRHIVMATGVSGIPNIPDIPGMAEFRGEVVHAHAYRDGEDWTGRRAIVIGTGNSGHDIAQDLHSSGADVTLVQRSPTLVVNIEPSAQLPYTLYEEGPPLEDCDLITASTPVPLARKAHQAFTIRARDLDQPLLDRLDRAGFRLDFGEDGTGWQFKYLTRGGGYYFNVGCSDLIADGKIRLIQFDRLERFVGEGARLKDGEVIAADLVVLATGYKGQEHLVSELLGEAVAARVGPIWGFGDGLELRNMYCRTAQPGLWFIAGSLAQCRINSKYLALQIKAVEEGLAPDDAAAS
jgi:cation diffusion facilitator CzcD-associated flavoprotein CzcO